MGPWMAPIPALALPRLPATPRPPPTARRRVSCRPLAAMALVGDAEARKPVWEAANAFVKTQALHVATRLNVAEALAAGPLAAADLAAKVGAKVHHARRQPCS